jgi:hypothetical protein
MKWNLVYKEKEIITLFRAVDDADIMTNDTLEQFELKEEAEARILELKLIYPEEI